MILGSCDHQWLLWKAFLVHACLAHLGSLQVIIIDHHFVNSRTILDRSTEFRYYSWWTLKISTWWMQDIRRFVSSTSSNLWSMRLETLKDMDPRWSTVLTRAFTEYSFRLFITLQIISFVHIFEIINLAAEKKRKKERIGTSRTPVCHLPACRLVRNTLLQSTAATSASWDPENEGCNVLLITGEHSDLIKLCSIFL